MYLSIYVIFFRLFHSDSKPLSLCLIVSLSLFLSLALLHISNNRTGKHFCLSYPLFLTLSIFVPFFYFLFSNWLILFLKNRNSAILSYSHFLSLSLFLCLSVTHLSASFYLSPSFYLYLYKFKLGGLTSLKTSSCLSLSLLNISPSHTHFISF